MGLSILDRGTITFLIYVNDLPDNLQSAVKLFADVTLLFLTVCNLNISANQLDKDMAC